MESKFETHWITGTAEIISSKSPVGPITSILLTIGMVPVILTSVFVILVFNTVQTDFLVFQSLAVIIAVIGPVLIWKYEMHVYPNFIQMASEVTPNEDNKKLHLIGKKYKRFFCDKYIYFTIPWALTICSALAANIGYFEGLGVNGLFDTAFIIYLIFAFWWSLITGIGLHGALTTILCIREVGNLNFRIDPLHPDGLGGLSSIGYFAIRSTTLNSVGALTIPLAFDIAGAGGYTILVYGIVAVYIGIIIFSFVYPTVYIHRRAKEIRNNLLEEKREKIHNLHRRIVEADNEADLNRLQVKLSTLRQEYNEYDQVNLYPMSVSIFSKLISSVMLPLFFVIIETYVIA